MTRTVRPVSVPIASRQRTRPHFNLRGTSLRHTPISGHRAAEAVALYTGTMIAVITTRRWSMAEGWSR